MDQVTLAICTYNNARLLDRALAAIQHQDYASKNWSTLVIDNNSTDDTAAVVDRYAAAGHIPGLRRVLECRQGLTYARRRAVAETDSEWIALIDDDCFIAPDWVRQTIAFCNAYPQAGAIGGRTRVAWEIPPDQTVARYRASFAEQDYGNQPLRIQPTASPAHLVGAGLVLRRQALRDCGWLDAGILTDRSGRHLTAGGDTEIVFRIRNTGYELWYNPAMSLEHFISRHRLSVPYLCRLQRGFGQSRPICKSLQFNRQDTLTWRTRLFWDHLRMFSRVAREYLHYRLIAPQALSPDYRIAFHFRLGQMEGAIRFLLKGYHP
ncbi:MAG: glycosyltransferase family 2 protein [Phycisphaerae bacterium]|nr:glycosyltransferase family 2 protein [Phycisphaerae bacterium]